VAVCVHTIKDCWKNGIHREGNQSHDGLNMPSLCNTHSLLHCMISEHNCRFLVNKRHKNSCCPCRVTSLTPWSRVLLEKLTSSQLVKKFPCILHNPEDHYLILKCLPPVLNMSQSIPTHPTSLRSILIVASHLRPGFPSGPFPQVSLPKPCIHLSSMPYILHLYD
jgi:hypothetical protein